MTDGSRPSAQRLWGQAKSEFPKASQRRDRQLRYLELMREHRLIVERQPGQPTVQEQLTHGRGGADGSARGSA